MEIEEIVLIASYIFYLGITLYLIKPKLFNYDVLKMELRLFPNFFKWVGVVVCLGIIIIGKIYWEDNEYTKEFVFYMLNLGLLFIVFSKEKIEDEFAHQLRLKSLIVSVIGTIAMFGACFPMYIFYVFKAKPWIANVSAPVIISVILVTHLLYFNYSKLRLRLGPN